MCGKDMELLFWLLSSLSLSTCRPFFQERVMSTGWICIALNEGQIPAAIQDRAEAANAIRNHGTETRVR